MTDHRHRAGENIAGVSMGGKFAPSPQTPASGAGLQTYPSPSELAAAGANTQEFVENVVELASAEFYEIDDLRRERDGSSRIDLTFMGQPSWLTRMRINADGQLTAMMRSYDSGATWNADPEGEESVRRIIWESQLLAVQQLRGRQDAMPDPLAAWA